MVYRFSKDLNEAIRDYLSGIEREYNRQIIIEAFQDSNSRSFQTDSYKVTIYFCSGCYERLRITKTK